eukprot:2202151-Lingulodinium_polyedra.AAC.1
MRYLASAERHLAHASLFVLAAPLLRRRTAPTHAKRVGRGGRGWRTGWANGQLRSAFWPRPASRNPR